MAGTGGTDAGVPSSPAAAVIDLTGVTDPDRLLQLARDELSASRVQSAVAVLDRYMALFPYGSDEAFYLYGLAWEQDTPFRNIRTSYAYYRKVRDEFPRSARWKEAAGRVAYLEKHYYGLR